MTDPSEGFEENEPAAATKWNSLWTPDQYQNFIDFCDQETGDELDFVFGRDFETYMRDGRQRTFSVEMVHQLGRMLIVFAMTRIQQRWKNTGVAPQRMRVQFRVSFDDISAPTTLQDGLEGMNRGSTTRP